MRNRRTSTKIRKRVYTDSIKQGSIEQIGPIAGAVQTSCKAIVHQRHNLTTSVRACQARGTAWDFFSHSSTQTAQPAVVVIATAAKTRGGSATVFRQKLVGKSVRLSIRFTSKQSCLSLYVACVESANRILTTFQPPRSITGWI